MEQTVTLFDDPSVREKLTVMSKWEVICDDARNNDDGFTDEQVSEFMEVGKTYKITMIIQEV
jgi:hypothetical protein